jgi:hypothetical protein
MMLVVAVMAGAAGLAAAQDMPIEESLKSDQATPLAASPDVSFGGAAEECLKSGQAAPAPASAPDMIGDFVTERKADAHAEQCFGHSLPGNTPAEKMAAAFSRGTGPAPKDLAGWIFPNEFIAPVFTSHEAWVTSRISGLKLTYRKWSSYLIERKTAMVDGKIDCSYHYKKL